MANDEKPKKKGAASLYDNSSMEDAPAKAKADEREGEEKAVERAAEDEGAEAAGMKAAGDAEPGKVDMFMDGLKAIHKRHEKERMDHHGAHREALRQMAARHNKEFGDHMALHFKEGEGEKPADEKPAGEKE